MADCTLIMSRCTLISSLLARTGLATVRRGTLTLLCFGALCTPGFARGMCAGRIINRIELLQATEAAMGGCAMVQVEFSADRYAIVRRGWISGFLDRFRADLSRKDVPVSQISGDSGWRAGFNCTAFTDLFLGNAGAELMVDQWHSPRQADRPAIVAVWYTPDDSRVDAQTQRRPAHSIVLILTDDGPVFVDPQRGEVRLSANELRTITHRRA